MTHPAAFRHLDDPDELADVSRELPTKDGGPARREAVLTIDGVHCAACVVSIEHALRGAVDEVTVNAATRRARVVWQPAQAPLSALFERIAGLGYQPRPVSRVAIASVEAAGRRKALWRMLVAVLCMMQVMMYAVPRYVAGPGEMSDDVHRLLTWAEWVLTLPALMFAAAPFFSSAWRDLRQRRIGMDVPVSLGILVTFVASSVAASAGHGDVYFDSLTMFVAFLLVGRWLEAAARERALVGVTDLLARLPESVERIDDDGRVQTVTIRRLRAGDRVRVAVGQSVPADGVVVDGASHADESLLTGESRPVSKHRGDPVTAGSLNLSGPLQVRVVRAARDSRLQEIADLIDEASTHKPRLAALADRWAGPFLAGIVLLAAAAWIAWQWIDPARAIWVAASLLIVTCPCALSLATPAALLAAAGNLARRGVLARSPQSIETLAGADTFVMDKTGTLTLDRLSIARVEASTLTAPEATAVAAALDAGSLHPVAGALRAAAAADGLPAPPVRDVTEAAGAGVAGQVLHGGQWRDARLGSPRFVAGSGSPPASARPPGAPAAEAPAADAVPADTVSADAASVWLSLDGAVVGRFELAETLRPDAAAAVAALRAGGASVEILSGDAPDRVARIAAALGIDQFHAAATPEEKLARLAERQRAGQRVVMVGDGINDAPVLAKADVSAAFATGAALAQHHADLLLLGERLGALPEARALGRRTMRIVRQNLAFAALYNVVCIPLALAGLLPPWLAGLGMAASSLVVVLNALRVAAAARRPVALQPLPRPTPAESPARAPA